MLTLKMKQACPLSALLAVLAAVPLAAQAPSSYVNFEGAQVNPVRISADGTRLFVVNTPNATLSVFSLATPASPALIAEIPVGIEPVSVNINPAVANNDEAWVVNEESDSVSVVSVSKGIVTDTLYAKNEPADVVFAGGNAFVSASRSNLVYVFSASTHALVQSIPLTGSVPRSLATSKNGSFVYVEFALSGNGTTTLPTQQAPPQVKPPDYNGSLPGQPPKVGLIVDAANPSAGKIPYTVPDNDVAVINATTFTVVKYFPHLGTDNMGLTVNPVTGMLYVANMDALNIINYETALNGHFVNNQITSVNPTTGATNIYDLNPNVDYGVLPNPAAIATALAMPTGVVFEPTGRYLYIAAFGTDRVGIFDTSNLTSPVTGFIEIDPQATGSTVNPATKRGPRGLALLAPNGGPNTLYVLNRISNTISVVNLSNNTVTGEIATGSADPTTEAIRNGRGFLYDAKLSGNGTNSCASCHVDSEMDLIAWNLGNPPGDMTDLQQGPTLLQFHPMKGPMTTQTLRGLVNVEPYHWRGDKPNFAAFNGAFAALMGGTQISDADMAAFTNFINTVTYMPNPNLNLDRTMPSSIQLPDYPASGDPNVGLTDFNTIIVNSANGHTCVFCHPGVAGTNSRIDQSGTSNGQAMKHSQLRNMYQKTAANFGAGKVSILGFSFTNDGSKDGVFQFLGGDEFPNIQKSTTDKIALDAYMMCFDTGTAPAVGYSITLNSGNVGDTQAQTNWSTLQTQAGLTPAANIDLIANGTVNGVITGLLYVPSSGLYQTGSTTYTQAQLITFIQNGDTLTVMGVPPGSGQRMGPDRKLVQSHAKSKTQH
jgi:YVTN family beta-propeller protein